MRIYLTSFFASCMFDQIVRCRMKITLMCLAAINLFTLEANGREIFLGSQSSTIFQSDTAKNQLMSNGRYRCVYHDTLSVSLTDEIFSQLAADVTRKNGLPDTFVSQIDSALRSQLASQPLTQIIQRTVDASPDSTVIELEEKLSDNSLESSLPYKKMVIGKGGQILSITGTGNQDLPIRNNEQRNFLKTGNRQIIAGYSCDEYILADRSVTIWITDKLPSYINPGVRNVNTEGAILAFTLNLGGPTRKSVVQEIKRE